MVEWCEYTDVRRCNDARTLPPAMDASQRAAASNMVSCSCLRSLELVGRTCCAVRMRAVCTDARKQGLPLNCDHTCKAEVLRPPLQRNVRCHGSVQSAIWAIIIQCELRVRSLIYAKATSRIGLGLHNTHTKDLGSLAAARRTECLTGQTLRYVSSTPPSEVLPTRHLGGAKAACDAYTKMRRPWRAWPSNSFGMDPSGECTTPGPSNRPSAGRGAAAHAQGAGPQARLALRGLHRGPQRGGVRGQVEGRAAPTHLQGALDTRGEGREQAMTRRRGGFVVSTRFEDPSSLSLYTWLLSAGGRGGHPPCGHPWAPEVEHHRGAHPRARGQAVQGAVRDVIVE